jgi:hypothetical protein
MTGHVGMVGRYILGVENKLQNIRGARGGACSQTMKNSFALRVGAP